MASSDTPQATVTEAEVRARAAEIEDAAFDAFIKQQGATEALDMAYGGRFSQSDRELQKGMVVIAHEQAAAARNARGGAPAGPDQNAAPSFTEEQVIAKGANLDDAAFDNAVKNPQAVAALDQAFGGRFSAAPREIQKGLVVLFAEAQNRASGGQPPEMPDEAFETFLADEGRRKVVDEVAQKAVGKPFAELPREQQKQIVTMVLIQAQQAQQGGGGSENA
jgi:hypothetical protein